MIDSELVLEATFDGKKAKDELDKFNTSTNNLIKTFNKLGESSNKNVKKQLDEVQKVSSKTQTNFNKLKNSAEQSNTIFDKLKNSVNKLKTSLLGADNGSKKLGDGLGKVSGASQKAGQNVKKLGNNLTDLSIGKLATIVALIKSMGFLYQNTVKASASIEDLNNAISISASNGGQEAIDFLNEFINAEIAIGAQSEVMVKKTLRGFTALLDPLDLGSEKMLEMATTLTSLSKDYASFYDISNESATQKLFSGMTGETLPLKELGVIVNENAVSQEALSLGMKKVNGEFTEQDKAIARFNVIMRLSANAIGDFERTSYAYNNQIRIAQTNLESLGIFIGSKLMPIFAPFVEMFNNLAVSFENFIVSSDKVNTFFEDLTTVIKESVIFVEAIFVSFGKLVSAIVNFGSSTDKADTSIKTLGDTLNTVLIIIEGIIDAIRSLIVMLDDLNTIMIAFTVDFRNMLKGNFEFKYTKEAIDQFKANFKKNTKDIITIGADDLKKQKENNEKNIKKSLQSQVVEVQTDVVLDTAVTKTVVPKSGDIKGIVKDFTELQRLTTEVREGDFQASLGLLSYYGTYAKLQKASIDNKGILLEDDKRSLGLLEDSLPLISKNLKMSNIQLEIQRKKLSYNKDINEAFDKEIDRIASLTVSYKGITTSLNDMSKGMASIDFYSRDIAYHTDVINNNSGQFSEKTKENSRRYREISEQLLKQLQTNKSLSDALSHQKDLAEKTALAIATWEVAVQPAIDSMNSMFDSISKGIDGDIMGSFQSAMKSIGSIATAAAGPIGGMVVGAVTGIVNSIVDLAMAVATAENKKAIAEIEKEMIEVERKAEELKIEVEALKQTIDDLAKEFDITNTQRETERLAYEKKLIEQGKTELEIEKELREFDRKSSEDRLKQIQEETKAIEDQKNKLLSQNVDIFDAEGNIDREKLKLAREREANAQKEKNNLQSILKEYQDLQTQAGDEVWDWEEDRAEELAKKLSGLGINIWDNIDNTNFGTDDLDRAIKEIEKKLQGIETGVLTGYTDEQIEALEGLVDLEKEQAEIELEFAKEKAELEQEIIDERNEQLEREKENIDRQFELLGLYKELGGSYQVSRQIALQSSIAGTTGLLNRPSENVNSIGTQINNTIVNQSYVNV